MSSRTDHRRRERSWEREDRDRDKYRDRDRDRDRYSRSSRPTTYRDSGRRRDSRSRSPRRDRIDYDREKDRDRDHKSTRRDERRDYDRDDRRADRREDERRVSRRDGKRDHESPEKVPMKDLDGRSKDAAPAQRVAPQHQDEHPNREPVPERMQSPQLPLSKPDHDSNDAPEEGEEMEVSTADEEAMMAIMGLSGFGSTKGKHVEGNQEGSVGIKKIRTWRQYMNRYSPVQLSTFELILTMPFQTWRI
ncbi:hypothetical protein EDD17DRAFT_1765820 [Pisolithus thermaeus]|nr:hypothetical protein EDD17DRAFT_1765820 [Pisolithus thermaeus]